jgi:hypothetical protein
MNIRLRISYTDPDYLNYDYYQLIYTAVRYLIQVCVG